MDFKTMLIGSVLFGTMTLVGLPRSDPATKVKECASCRVPAGAVRLPNAECLDTLLLTSSGPYQYIVTVGGRRMGNASIFGDTTQGSGGTFTASGSVPAAGLEEIVITDSADTFQATTDLTVMDAMPAPGPDVNVMSVASEVATPTAPTLPTTDAYGSSVIAPPTDVRVATSRAFDGQLFYKVPGLSFRSNSNEPVELYLRALNGTPLKEGKRCRKRLDGRPCADLPGRRLCDAPSVVAIGAAAAVSSTIQVLGNSIQVNFFSLPVKRVVICNVYKCVDGKLVFDYSEKCVRYGSVSWGFNPTAVPGAAGQIAVQILLGMDVNGYIWAPRATCTRS